MPVGRTLASCLRSTSIPTLTAVASTSKSAALLDLSCVTLRSRDLARFHEAVVIAIFYYNTERIHTGLKMNPAAYAARLEEQSQVSKSLERVV